MRHLISQAVRRSRYFDSIRYFYSSALELYLAASSFSRRDRDRLVAYLYWLEAYKYETNAVLDADPLTIVTSSSNWRPRIVRWCDGIRRWVARRMATLCQPSPEATDAEGFNASADPNASPDATKVVAPTSGRRWWTLCGLYLAMSTGLQSASTSISSRVGETRFGRTLHFARRAIRYVMYGAVLEMLRVRHLYWFSRRSAYDLLVRNGDLSGAAYAFNVLSQVRASPTAALKALDRLMVRLIPVLKRIEEDLEKVSAPPHPGRRRLVISVVVWGDSYLDLFMRYAIPALLSDGNLPAVAADVDVLWHVFSTAEGHARLERSDEFKKLSDCCELRKETIPDDLIALAQGENRYWLYGGLTQLSFRLAARLGADMHFLNPDTVYSRDFFSSLLRITQDPEVNLVVSNSFRTVKDSILPALEARRNGDGTLTLSARELHALGLDHLHPSSRKIFVTPEQLTDGLLPRSTIFVRVERNALVIRSAHYQPLFISHDIISEKMKLSYFTVDSSVLRHLGVTDELIPHIRFVTEEDDIGYFEMSSQDLFEVMLIPASQVADLFWETNDETEFALLKREVRLPLQGTPTNLPIFESKEIEGAFGRFLDLIRQRRPKAKSDGFDSLGLTELARQADALVGFEVQQGCGKIADAMSGKLTSIVSKKGAFRDGAYRDDFVLSVSFLRLGLLDPLLELRQEFGLKFGLANDAIGTVSDFCQGAYKQAEAAGAKWREQQPSAELFVLGCVVWGSEYVKNFLEFNVRSMLAPGNLPSIAEDGRCALFVVTDQAGRRMIEQHPIYAEVAKFAEWTFWEVPEELFAELVKPSMAEHFYMLYGLLDHISIFFAQAAHAHLFMIPVDSVVADGSLKNMAGYRHQGYGICGGGNIVGETETFLPALAKRYNGGEPISISAEELASLAIQHPHHYFVSQVICAENKDFGTHPRELFWPVPGGIEIHSCFIHPLFTAAFSLQRYRRKHLANVDYGMIPRMYTESKEIKIITDPREAYINNFASGKRRYETTGRPFSIDDFLEAHKYTFGVQRRLFAHGQVLPCSYSGLTPCRDVRADVASIWNRLTA